MLRKHTDLYVCIKDYCEFIQNTMTDGVLNDAVTIVTSRRIRLSFLFPVEYVYPYFQTDCQ